MPGGGPAPHRQGSSHDRHQMGGNTGYRCVTLMLCCMATCMRRLNNDLLMWEPFSPLPSPSEPVGGPGFMTSPFASGTPTSVHWPENFQMCKSAFKLDSDSEEEDSHFYSVEEMQRRKKEEQRRPCLQSSVSILLCVGKGRVTALCEAKGEGGKKLEGSHGELVLDVESGSLFSVSKYKGREDLGYFCLEAEKVALYHKAVMEDYFMPEQLEIPSFLPPEGLHPTIYASQDGNLAWPPGSKKDGPQKMLSLAIQINLDLEKNIKEFLVTLRLEGATLRHSMALAHQSWYSQLIDFLDVLDDPILGFVPPTIITVLHTHLFSCAVDYRPLYLPIRVLITAETFTLSSNIIVDTSVFLLRFILDDSALYLSNKCDSETGDLRKDYVCVVDVDLLELVITTWKGATAGKLVSFFEATGVDVVVPFAGCGGCLKLVRSGKRLIFSPLPFSSQDALFFLKDFFASVAASINPVVPLDPGSEGPADASGKEPEGAEGEMTASVETTASETSSVSNASSSSSEQPIYFREFQFTSEVPIWLDYHGKHVTVDQMGTFAGILIGLAQLNCSELKLKRLCCQHGLLGVEKVVSYALTEWLTDIRKNQLPGILGGVGPMHSVVQLFHGLRDLFWLPIEQYRKDGRIIRGLQRGAASFGTSTASAALELSNRLVQAIQATAETVYDILSPTAPLSTRTLLDKKSTRKLRRGQQPADLREGVAKAYDTVREGVIDTAQAICDVAARGHEQKGITGAVGGVLRQIPPTVVKPLIVASEATSSLLGGMRNQIKPDARKEESLKWRSEEAQE
ncbi:LOW QUALITY PROTEIN: autophagy-related protein 2 homolog A-like [Pogona vitticeps]